jgi:hypothetical protein
MLAHPEAKESVSGPLDDDRVRLVSELPRLRVELFEQEPCSREDEASEPEVCIPGAERLPGGPQ